MFCSETIVFLLLAIFGNMVMTIYVHIWLWELCHLKDFLLTFLKIYGVSIQKVHRF